MVRSSKGTGGEDYFVDAVEVVSFGHSFFFRSLERPKSFLVPVGDYEILELKETRMVLKSMSTERSIKIGGGREVAPPREQEASSAEPRSGGQERKRDKRRRGRRGRDRSERQMDQSTQVEEKPETPEEQEMRASEAFPMEPPAVEGKSPSFISKLFPPPSTLIKESLTRYKPAESSEEEFPPSTESEKEDETEQ